MKREEIEAFGLKAAKSIKSEKDLNEFRKILTKITVEAALNAKLEKHLGYSKNDTSDNPNSPNDYSSKSLRTVDGQLEIETPRDRHGDYTSF